MEITKGLHTLLAKVTAGLTGVDLLAATYSALATIETLAKKLREAKKAEIFASIKGKVLSEAQIRVKELDRSEAVPLLQGRTYIVTGVVKCGASYIDMGA